jgi:thiol-disulfide isomerase/thioredoxin
MSVLVHSQQELNECLKAQPKVAVLFYASWCPFSRRFLPLFEQQAKGKECYRRVIVDELDDLVDKYEIEFYPTVIYFEKGKIVRRLDAVHEVGLNDDQLAKFVADCRLP